MNINKSAGLLAVLFAVAIPAYAQQPPQAPPRPRDPMGREGMRQPPLSVEAALRMKEELKLTDAQATQLEALRKEIVADRQAKARDMIDTQSRVAAGLLNREDIRKQFEGKRDALRQTMQQRQDRIAKVLTTDQQQQLARAEFRHMRERMGGRGRMGGGRERMGPGGGRREFGRGMRRGFRPGRMGPGFGPGGFDN